jgi:uncharacterized protein YjiS (DUF1127 family)
MTLTLPTTPDVCERPVGRLNRYALAIGAFLRAMRNRRAVLHIADLPDNLLADLGLRRDDVHEALATSWREDPTYRLANCARRRAPNA